MKSTPTPTQVRLKPDCWLVKLLYVTVPPEASMLTAYEFQRPRSPSPVSQVASEPSRLWLVLIYAFTVVGVPFGCSRSAAVWSPSPFVSRYTYWADAGAANRPSSAPSTRSGQTYF